MTMHAYTSSNQSSLLRPRHDLQCSEISRVHPVCTPLSPRCLCALHLVSPFLCQSTNLPLLVTAWLACCKQSCENLLMQDPSKGVPGTLRQEAAAEARHHGLLIGCRLGAAGTPTPWTSASWSDVGLSCLACVLALSLAHAAIRQCQTVFSGSSKE